MGLDNIPSKYPCVVRGYAVYTSDGRIDCDKTDCPFKKLPHTIGILGTYCWIRGGVYNEIVCEATDNKYSLYDDLSYSELEEILEALRKYTPGDDVKRRKTELEKYLETLLREVEPVKNEFKLIAWY